MSSGSVNSGRSETVETSKSATSSSSSSRFAQFQSSFYRKTSFAPKIKKKGVLKKELEKQEGADKGAFDTDIEKDIESLAAEALIASAHRQAVSASVDGPGAAYNGRKIGKVNRTFLNNTVVAAIGGNRRRERQAEASAASASAAANGASSEEGSKAKRSRSD